MKRLTQILMVVTTVIAFSFTPLFAQEMDHSKMGQGRGMESMTMDKKMQELRQHEHMMEGIKDQNQMMVEMRKHMRMMTDMVGEMMRQRGAEVMQPISLDRVLQRAEIITWSIF